jgi:eukaryotic-like serine/threonine-protein kinase
MALPLSGERTPLVLGDSAYGKEEGRFSPDARWISYGSDETGGWEVHVATFPAFENRRAISLRGGTQGRWRADGKELFYLAPDGKLMSVAVRGTGTDLEFGAPVSLVQSPLENPAATVPQFDPSRNGQRFLFIAPLKGDVESVVSPVTVVLNWQHALRK